MPPTRSLIGFGVSPPQWKQPGRGVLRFARPVRRPGRKRRPFSRKSWVRAGAVGGAGRGLGHVGGGGDRREGEGARQQPAFGAAHGRAPRGEAVITWGGNLL